MPVVVAIRIVVVVTEIKLSHKAFYNKRKMKLRFTTLLYKKKVEGNFIGLYNPIEDHNFVFMPQELFDEFSREMVPQGEVFNELVEKKFLVPYNFSEKEYLVSFTKELKIDIHLMYLLVAQSCNLSCGYCFESLENITGKLMSNKVATKAIDYFFRVSTPERKVIFYGGEPLLNRDVFIEAVQRIRNHAEKGFDTKISMVTNGTLLDKQLSLFIKDNRVDVAVSIDGPKNIHNLSRKNKGNKGSFEEALYGFNLLKNIGANPSISCTIGKHNVGALEEVTHYFVDDLRPYTVGFNLMIGDNGLTCGIDEATESLLKAYKILRDGGIYEDRIMRRLEPLLNGKFHLKDCAAYGNQIAVRYDGKVGPCHAFCAEGSYFEGDISNIDFEIDKKIFEKWKNRSQLFNPECVKCPAILLCGGGCAYNAHLKTCDINGIDTNICTHTQILLNWIIDEIWQNKKANSFFFN